MDSCSDDTDARHRVLSQVYSRKMTVDIGETSFFEGRPHSGHHTHGREKSPWSTMPRSYIRKEKDLDEGRDLPNEGIDQ